MGEKMTLAGVAADLHRLGMHGYAQIIDAHLTQPAQAVDVEKVREVIEQTREYYERTDHRRTAYALEAVLSDIYETLTAALPNANGKEDTPDAAR